MGQLSKLDEYGKLVEINLSDEYGKFCELGELGEMGEFYIHVSYTEVNQKLGVLPKFLQKISLVVMMIQ